MRTVSLGTSLFVWVPLQFGTLVACRVQAAHREFWCVSFLSMVSRATAWLWTRNIYTHIIMQIQRHRMQQLHCSTRNASHNIPYTVLNDRRMCLFEVTLNMLQRFNNLELMERLIKGGPKHIENHENNFGTQVVSASRIPPMQFEKLVAPT